MVFDQIPHGRQTELSAAAYIGCGIFLNCVSSRLVAVDLDLKKVPPLAKLSPENLAYKIAWRLEQEKIPLFSAILIDADYATLLWILRQPMETVDLHQIYTIESGLESALASLGATSGKGLTRTLPLPLQSETSRGNIRLVTNAGFFPLVDVDRLIESVSSSVTIVNTVALHRSYEVLQELNALYFHRVFEIARQSERCWVWLSAYAAAIKPFVDINEHKRCVRAVSESLRNKKWRTIHNETIPNSSITFQGLLDIIVRNSRADTVRLADQKYYNINRLEWAREASALLDVSRFEIGQLGFRHFIRESFGPVERRYISCPQRIPIGIDDNLPVNRFLMHAA